MPAVVQEEPALPAGVSGDWWTSAQKTIRESEYDLRPAGRTATPEVPAAWQAPNRANNLRTYFTPQGVRVVPRVKDGPAWTWGLSLKGYGYEGDVRPVSPASLAPAKNHMEYGRAELTEWYVNDERGLEQGFTLSSPPARSREEAGSWLVLKMDLQGDLKGSLGQAAREIAFAADSGAGVVRYGGLKALDANGRNLPARFALQNKEIDILVDAANAVYPITVDPVAQGVSPDASWTAESDQAYAFLGYSVATAGDVNGDGYSDVIVGAYRYDDGEGDEGVVFVYHGSASGPSSTADWTAESNQVNAYFGYSVATAGDVNGDGYADVIVGATQFWNEVPPTAGRVFVYHGSAAGLNPSANWSVGADQDAALFGYSVSTAGDVNGDGYSDVMVGAPEYNSMDNGEDDEGTAFVFHGSASGLSLTANWTVDADQQDAYLGYSVSTAGDVNGDGYSDVIVGAYRYDNGQNDEGRAFVYHGSASGLSLTSNWTAEADQAGAYLGCSVGTAGDVNGDGYSDVVVGSYSFDNGQANEGRAFVYHGSDSGLSLTSNWTAEADLAGAYFGYSVGTAGDVNGDGFSDVIVGAMNYTNGQSYEGRAFIYHGSTSGLSLSANWTAESDQADGNFGRAVATAGDVNGDGFSDVIVGSPNFNNGQAGEGRAYAYLGSASGLGSTSGWTGEANQAGARLGYDDAVGTAGDVNGDGYADIILGAPFYDNGEANEGRAFVFHGSAVGPGSTPDWTAESDQAGSQFGRSVASAGDVNGDGYSDVIVGASLFDNGETDEGRAYVYYGSALGLSLTPNWTAESDQAGAGFGLAVSDAGDVNGDGYSDVIAGAYRYDNGETDEGRAYVYHGSASGLSLTPNWTAESDQAEAAFGVSVDTAGDVNGDGYSDVIVGAHQYDHGETDEGSAFVYHGSASGLSLTPHWTAESNQAGAQFGRCVSAGGDINGDGYSDVLVGAPLQDFPNSDEGYAFAYGGSAMGLDGPFWSAHSFQANAEFGRSVGTAGDVNGDGYSDIIVGAYAYGGAGRAYVYYGSSLWLGAGEWVLDAAHAGDRLGISVGTAGDVNGDGYADVLIAADMAGSDAGQDLEGQAYLFYGNAGAGRAHALMQREATGPAPIAPLGVSDSSTSFRLQIIGHTPYGRGKIKLQWEVKPLGTPFDGTGLGQSSSWEDTGTVGIELVEQVQGLQQGTPYHWRVRLLYDAATVPFQRHSRWLSPAWNGSEETDLKTAADSDGDGLPDYIEDPYCTETLIQDTDGDGLWDGVEDADLDGIVDPGETDPCDLDTDDDGLYDGTEKILWGSRWNEDSDGDGLINLVDPDSDNDGINDGEELAYWGGNWDQDPDGDGLINLLDPDSDNDGFKDGLEIRLGFDPADPGSHPVVGVPAIEILLLSS